MSHYTIKDGPFDSACKRLLSDGFTLAWGELLSQVKKHKDRDDDDDDEDEDSTNRVKYTCPLCSVNVLGVTGPLPVMRSMQSPIRIGRLRYAFNSDLEPVPPTRYRRPLASQDIHFLLFRIALTLASRSAHVPSGLHQKYTEAA
jgi:hypothetical protein